jgi:hypothetical protein
VYQEGSAEIARTQNVPWHRAPAPIDVGLEQLREALDTKNEGDRRAWTAVLLYLSERQC